MRRLLKAIAKNEKIGDVSTLEDGAAVNEIQSVFKELQKNIQNQKPLTSNHLVLFLHLHLMPH